MNKNNQYEAASTKSLFLIIALFLLPKLLYGIGAYPYPIDYNLPDGTTITITLKGDENVHWATSEDGYTLLLNKGGYYEYAAHDENNDLVLSGIRAKNIHERSGVGIHFTQNLRKDLRYSREQVHYMLQIRDMRNSMAKSIEERTRSGQKSYVGKVRAPLILVEFPGKLFTKNKNDFELLMNQPNYTAGGNTGSVYDYFQASSYGQLQYTVDIYGPYTLSHDIGYYDNESDGDSREMAREAAIAAHNDGCNFANYDIDNDGFVDGMHIIFAGYGQDSGATVGQSIWSHAWSIHNSILNLDGKRVYSFSCSPELRGESGSNITYIGVIAHELSHVFGLPDLYDTDYGDSGGESVHLAHWDIMAGGGWNDNGRTPAYHSAWCRNFLGWVNTVTLSSPANITIPNPETQGASYRINTATNNEYFLIENRQKTGWDAYIAGSGMLIYHVDENYSGWNYNCINCNPDHRGLYIKQANGGAGSNSTTEANAPYPAAANTSFTDTSTPNSKSWANANTNKPVTEIVHNTGNRTISFKFMDGMSTQYSVNLSASPANGGTVTGNGSYYKDSQVTVNATPNTNFSFVNWTKNGIQVSTNSSYTFSITENTTLVANFESSSVNLASLAVTPGELSPAFSVNTTNYTVNVANNINSITLSATTANAGATVSGTGTHSLNVGNNSFNIVVRAQNGATKTYTITVARAAAGNNTNLQSLSVDAGTLMPAFNPSITNYALNVEHAVIGVEVSAAAVDPNATVTGTGYQSLVVGRNVINVMVTAENGTNVKIYTITIVRESNNNANLSSLSVDSGELTPAFNPDVTNYSVTVGADCEGIVIIGEVADAGADVLGNGYYFLDSGNNKVDITVIAPDGITIKTYSVVVTRQENKNSDNSLKSIMVNNITVNPKVGSVDTYTITIEYTTSITINATPNHAAANVNSQDIGVKPVQPGKNVFYIRVTAQDGTMVPYLLEVTVSEKLTGVNEIDLYQLTVYPNPADEYVNISGLQGKGELMLLDISGKLLIKRNITSAEEQLYVGNLPRGGYLIRITVGKTMKTFKIIVQ